MSNKLMTPANPSYANYFRRRTIGRAASPPTFACYEQRGNPYDNDDDEYSDDEGSDSEDHDHEAESCSEDGEHYGTGHGVLRHPGSASDASDTEDAPHPHIGSAADVESMELDDAVAKKAAEVVAKKDVKGKQRAVDPEPEMESPSPSPKRAPRAKKARQPVYTLRPILTIQRSQGFVWNQDLFVPPYIKDRYAFSTSPPNSSGFISTSASSTNSALDNYEVEVVEIRVNEGDLDGIIP